MKMLKEINELWVNALRSGKFKQGKEMLQDSEKHFCCLGVLCSLYNKEKHSSWKDLNINGDEILPKKVMNWAGLTSQNPNVKYKDGTLQTLSNFNDGISLNMRGREMSPLNFNEIADIIEVQL